MNPSLDPDVRADLMIHEMTLDEKIQLVHGVGWGVLRAGAPVPPQIMAALDSSRASRGCIFLTSISPTPRWACAWPHSRAAMPLYFPQYWHVRILGSRSRLPLRFRYWPRIARAGVQHVHRRRDGPDREPRNGRNFEYSSEDPILAGTMVGQLARGVQSNHIMGDIKHYVLTSRRQVAIF